MKKSCCVFPRIVNGLPIYRDDYERGLAAIRAGLSDEALAAAWAAGRKITMAEAIACALR
jgi:hypothetical protein